MAASLLQVSSAVALVSGREPEKLNPRWLLPSQRRLDQPRESWPREGPGPQGSSGSGEGGEGPPPILPRPEEEAPPPCKPLEPE